MQYHKFYRFGQIVYSLRWLILCLWLITIFACIPLLTQTLNPFQSTGFEDDNSKSTIARQFLNAHLGYNSNNKFLILYHNPKLTTDDPLYLDNIKKSLKNLKHFPINHDIILPTKESSQISKDKHWAYVVVIIKRHEPINDSLLKTFKSEIKTPKGMTLQLGGESIFTESLNKQTERDLYNADFIATPVSIITLILVFGSIIAAILPVCLGGGCALLILSTLYLLGHAFTLSIFTLNIALLLGLCLSLDYALFIISRFRDELAHGREVKEAIAITQSTAGKATFYSGLALFASLSALLLFPINILFSVAVGGLTAVLMAIITAIIILPAILSILGKHINLLTIRFFKNPQSEQAKSWRWLAETVVRRPLVYFVSILVVLLLLGHPFLSANYGVSDFRIFPEHSENRLFFDTFSKQFNENQLTPISILVKTHKHSVFTYKHLSNLYDLTTKLKENPLILDVNSIVNTHPRLTKMQYYQLYHLKSELMSQDVKQLLDITSGPHFTLIDITSKFGINTPETKQLISELNRLKPAYDTSLTLTGTPVDNDDVLHTIGTILPYALIWIMAFTYLILLLLLRSLFLPFKAILMNLLSLTACYGALVLVFQDGYLHQLLNFQPQGMLDVSLLVIIFCAIFGFSMDYEVFLLSRIKEAYEQTHDNDKSIIFGIEKSSRIITSAAIIVILLCSSFLVADVLMVKAFGLGIAVAIFIDAFLIRTLLVPATMALIKDWNWYLPRWLHKLLN